MEDEKSGFVKLFGDNPTVRVIDFLITFREFDYPLTEISENAGVAWSTIHTIFPKLVELGVVKQTRKIGRAILYKLNTDNSVVKELIVLDHSLIREFADHTAIQENKIAISVAV